MEWLAWAVVCYDVYLALAVPVVWALARRRRLGWMYDRYDDRTSTALWVTVWPVLLVVSLVKSPKANPEDRP